MISIAISNIAWRAEEDIEVQALLRKLGIQAIEVAPTRITPRPVPFDARTATEVRSFRRQWESAGFQVIALQSLLYGQPDLQVFGTDESRKNLAHYLDQIFELAREGGAPVLVFGSPSNRKAGHLNREEAATSAGILFREIGKNARRRGVTLALEPNPPIYGCDFLTTAGETVEWLDREAPDGEGLGLHLDAGGIYLAGEDPIEAARLYGGRARHFHVSAPQLAPIGPDCVIDYPNIFSALKYSGYDGYVSIEMKAHPTESNLTRIENAIRYTRSSLTGTA